MNTNNEIKKGKVNLTMEDIREELIEKITQHSLGDERLMCLTGLASLMMGKINADCVSDSEEVRDNYLGWLEALLDTIAELAEKQTKAMDSIIEFASKGLH